MLRFGCFPGLQVPARAAAGSLSRKRLRGPVAKTQAVSW